VQRLETQNHIGLGLGQLAENFNPAIIKQVASNKSSLLLKIILQNTQTLQLFTKIIKTESIY
jgi:hypothetical protein